MPNQRPDSADRQAEILDVQLLDVFAQIEALMRSGREIQREALRLRGVPSRVGADERQDAGHVIRERLARMTGETRALGDVIKELNRTARALETLLDGGTRSRPRG